MAAGWQGQVPSRQGGLQGHQADRRHRLGLPGSRPGPGQHPSVKAFPHVHNGCLHPLADRQGADKGKCCSDRQGRLGQGQKQDLEEACWERPYQCWVPLFGLEPCEMIFVAPRPPSTSLVARTRDSRTLLDAQNMADTLKEIGSDIKVTVGLRKTSPSWKAAQAVGFTEVSLSHESCHCCLPPFSCPSLPGIRAYAAFVTCRRRAPSAPRMT